MAKYKIAINAKTGEPFYKDRARTRPFYVRTDLIKSMEPIDCRSEVGITIGLIDGIISAARILARRDLTDPNIVEALKDIRADEDVHRIVGSAKE
jgi:hypothetical protein